MTKSAFRSLNGCVSEDLIMQKILEPILVTIIFVGSYILNYSCFDICLSDDVEFKITENTKSAKYIKKPMAFGESFSS